MGSYKNKHRAIWVRAFGGNLVLKKGHSNDKCLKGLVTGKILRLLITNAVVVINCVSVLMTHACCHEQKTKRRGIRAAFSNKHALTKTTTQTTLTK